MIEELSKFTLGPISVSALDATCAVNDEVLDGESLALTFDESSRDAEGGYSTCHFLIFSDPDSNTTTGVRGLYKAHENRSLEPPTRFALAAANLESRPVSIFYPIDLCGETSRRIQEMLIGINNYLQDRFDPNAEANSLASIRLLFRNEAAVQAWRFSFKPHEEHMHELVECLYAIDRVRSFPKLQKKIEEREAAVREYYNNNPDAKKHRQLVSDVLRATSERVLNSVLLEVVKLGRLQELHELHKALKPQEAQMTQKDAGSQLMTLMINWAYDYTQELAAFSAYKMDMANYIGYEEMQTFLCIFRNLDIVKFNRLTDLEKEAVVRLMLRRSMSAKGHVMETYGAKQGVSPNKSDSKRAVNESARSATGKV